MVERRLPPWEEITYFDLPKTSFPTVAVGGQIVAANPQRVILSIGSDITVGNTAILTPNAPGQAGFLLSSSVPQIVLREKDDATLCTAAWFNQSASPHAFHVIEVILRQWPDENPL